MLFFNEVPCPPAQRAHAQAGERGGYKSPLRSFPWREIMCRDKSTTIFHIDVDAAVQGGGVNNSVRVPKRPIAPTVPEGHSAATQCLMDEYTTNNNY